MVVRVRAPGPAHPPGHQLVRVAGETAKLGRVWPHMLRHSCGYYLADKGIDLRTMQDWATAIPSTRRTTRVLRGIGSMDYGDRLAGLPF
jgi:integrase